MEAIEHPPIFRLPGIPDHVTYTWLVMIILAGLAFVGSRHLQLVPRGVQNFLEVVLEQFQQMIDDVMGSEGLLPYLKHFAGPVPLPLKPLMFVIEIISHLARPLSLTLRLFGNIVGGHILLAVIFLLMGLDGLIGWALSGSVPGAIIGGLGGIVTIVFTVGFLYPLKILVAFLQAFIFVMLTMLYIAGAIEESEHHAEQHAGHH